MFDTVISGGIIISAHNRYTPLVGSIGITDGRIEYVGPKLLHSTDGKNYLDASGHIILPGLVNGHCHGDMGFAKGAGDNLTLGEQMQVFADNSWFYNSLSSEDRFWSRKHTYAEALLSGTTMLMENMYWSLDGDLSQKAFSEIGLRGAPAEDVRFDFSRSDGFLTPEMLDQFTQRCLDHHLIPVLGTLPEEEFNDERLKKVRQVVDERKSFFTSHLAETTWRLEASINNMGARPVAVLDRYGLLNERYIGSHAVYLNQDDINLMAQRGAKVVNTPICEMKIGDGIAPIPQMVKAGVTVALGTDGAMWSNSNDIFREMKCMVLLHSLNSGVRSLTAADVLDMATINGAKLFGLEKDLGTIEQGKLADLVLLNAKSPHMSPLRTGVGENVSSTVVYCATGSDVTDVFVNGKHVVRNRALTTANLDEILQKTSEISQKVFCG